MLKSLFLRQVYKLKDNPFPTSVVSWGSRNVKENGSIYNPNVRQRKVEEFLNRIFYNGMRNNLKFGFV